MLEWKVVCYAVLWARLPVTKRETPRLCQAIVRHFPVQIASRAVLYLFPTTQNRALKERGTDGQLTGCIAQPGPSCCVLSYDAPPSCVPQPVCTSQHLAKRVHSPASCALDFDWAHKLACTACTAIVPQKHHCWEGRRSQCAASPGNNRRY